ncbi:MAG: Rieske 2Fe-2S domain-containing protein [Alphaproteobacteria bacterium]|nr:Rieske 2Fe-2S domain-containing protein [Alphaproteobacteria bacterium]
MNVFLCRADEISEGEAKSFIIGEGKGRRDVVVVRRNGNYHAYVNSCPHQLMPLETFPDKFLNEDGSLFVCSTHGARFRVEDGFCISGPCEGKSLHALTVALDEGRLLVPLSSPA